MSVDTSGRSRNGEDRDATGAPAEANEPASAGEVGTDPGDDRPSRTRRPSALERVAGAIPDGRDVATSLDEFIAEAVAVDARDPGEEHAARARAAAEAARASARAEAEREIKQLARKSAQQVAELAARLAEAEERAKAAEERARTVAGAMRIAADPRARVRTQKVRAVGARSPAAVKRLSAAIAVVLVAIAVVLVGRGRVWGGPARKGPAQDSRAAGSAGKPTSGAQAAPVRPQAPEPVVRSMLPAEPKVTPLDDESAPGRKPRPRPARVARPPGSKKPARTDDSTPVGPFIPLGQGRP